MAGPAERRFSQLAGGTQRRWIGAYGGPRSLPPAERRRRAERAYQAGAHLPAEHTGHGRQTEAIFSAVSTTNGVEAVVGVTYLEKRRLGAYAHDTRLLLRGEMSDRDFQRKWSRRKLAVGPDVRLVADPRQVRAMWAVHGASVPAPFYRRRQRRA